MKPVIVSQSCLKQANWNYEQDHKHDESSDLFPQRKSPENGFKSHFRDLQGLAEDKRFAQFAVPESAFAMRSASSTAAPFFLSLFRPPDALGQNAHAA